MKWSGFRCNSLQVGVLLWLNCGEESLPTFCSVWSWLFVECLNLPTLTLLSLYWRQFEVILIFSSSLAQLSPFCKSPYNVRVSRNSLLEEDHVLGDTLSIFNHPWSFYFAKGLKWQPLENNYMKHHVWAKCEMSPVPTEAIDIFIKY